MVIGGEQGEQGNHEAGQSRGQPWPGSNPADRGRSASGACSEAPPSLTQIQVMARSAPEPGESIAKNSTCVRPGHGPSGSRVCGEALGLCAVSFKRGSATPQMVCQTAPKRTRTARHHPAPPAWWPAVQDRWLRLGGEVMQLKRC